MKKIERKPKKNDLKKILDITKAFEEICLLWESIDSYYYNIMDLPETDCKRLVVGVNSILLKLNDKYS